MSTIIPIDTNLDTMKLFKRLCAVALDAHSVNVSPVDIKEKLRDLPTEQLLLTAEALTKTIQERETVFNG